MSGSEIVWTEPNCRAFNAPGNASLGAARAWSIGNRIRENSYTVEPTPPNWTVDIELIAQVGLSPFGIGRDGQIYWD
ncbi:hypothetical protein AB4144_41795, partial [Rhizobiaceae sp. 2RAB30]